MIKKEQNDKESNMFSYKIKNEDDLRGYADFFGIEEELLFNAIPKSQLTNYNEINNNYEPISEVDMKFEELIKLIKTVRAENRVIKTQVETTRWLLTILISVFGIITPLLFTMHSRYIDSKFDAYTTNVNSKFELIQQQLNSQKEINSLQIQRDVSQELLKQRNK